MHKQEGVRAQNEEGKRDCSRQKNGGRSLATWIRNVRNEPLRLKKGKKQKGNLGRFEQA